MMAIILPLISSFLLTILSIPVTIILAKKFDLVDDPQKRPHPARLHTHPIPRAGGLTLYLGIAATILITLPWNQQIAGIIAGLTLLLIIGLIDDKLPSFNPYLRLLLLFVAASFPVFAGAGIHFITNPLWGVVTWPEFLKSQYLVFDRFILPFQLFGQPPMFTLSSLLAFFWIVTLTQIVNWSKGVDGQMPSITLITALVLAVVSLKFFFQGDIEQLKIAQLALIVAGASAAFLLFNWHPAKIFPGFSGSTIPAFMLAVLSILSGAKLATALLVLGIPTADFIYTFFRRIAQGHSPVWGDRGHLHHRLLEIGWSHQQITLFYLLLSVILGAVAILVDSQSKLFAAGVVGAVFTGIILWLNSFGKLSEP